MKEILISKRFRLGTFHFVSPRMDFRMSQGTQVNAASTGGPRKWEILILFNHPGPRASDQGPHPEDFWVSPGMESPQPPWEAYPGHPGSRSQLNRNSSWSLLCFSFCPLLPPSVASSSSDNCKRLPPTLFSSSPSSASISSQERCSCPLIFVIITKNSPISIPLLFWGAHGSGMVCCWVEGMDHLPHSTGNTANAAQDASAFLTARSGFCLLVHQDLWGLFCKAAFQTGVPHHILVLGNVPSQVQKLEFLKVPEMSPFLYCGLSGWQLGPPKVPAMPPFFISSAQFWIIFLFVLL